MKPECSIVIRCHNEEKHIGRLLTGILEQTVKEVEIIVVDSGSTDATLSIASHFPVRIFSIDKKEFSFGRALNVGCSAATADIIVIASAHTYPVYANWLEDMLVPFKDQKIGLTYGKQRGDKRSKFSEQQLFRKWYPDKVDYFYQDHPFCNNANSAIRRSLFEQVPFDTELTGLEDLDWASKITKMGYQIAYAADAEIIHVHEETYKQVFNRFKREAIAMKRIFPHEHLTFLDFLRLFFANNINDYLYAMKTGELMKFFGEIPAFRFAQFYGAYKGFNLAGEVDKTLKQHFYYPLNNAGSAGEQGDSGKRVIKYGKSEP